MLKKNNIINFFLGTLLSIVLLYLSLKNFDQLKFFQTFRQANFEFIFISILLLIFSVYIRGVRWNILLRKKATNRFLYKAEFIGYFGNNVLPLRLGELLRTYVVGEKYSISKSIIFGSIILERILDMLAAGSLLLIILILNPLFLTIIDSYLFIGIISMLGIGILGLIFSLFKNTKIFKNKHNRILIIIKDIHAGFTNYNKKNIFNIISLTIFIWLIYFLNVYLMQAAFNLNLSIYQSLILLLITTVAISIPALPGNIGTFEGSVVYSLSLFGLVDNFGFGFILHAVSFLPFTAIGLIYFLKEYKLFRKINVSKV